MSELAGFEGGLPGWLPPAAARSVAEAERVCARESRQAEAEREARAESARSRAIESYRAAAELRGEVISPMQLATGAGLGRTVQQIFAEAESQADRMDAREVARMRTAGEAPALHLLDAEVTIHGPSSPVKRSIASRSRRWRDWQEKKLETANALAAVEAEMDYGLVPGVTLRDRRR